MRRFVLVSFVLTLGVALAAANVRGETPETAAATDVRGPSYVSLGWNVPERCAMEAEFRDWVRAHTSGVVWLRGEGDGNDGGSAESLPAESTLHVSVLVEPDLHRGSVEIQRSVEAGVAAPGATAAVSVRAPTSRSEVTHEDCRQVALGLAFVLAVALDPTLALAGPPGATDVPVVEPGPAPEPPPPTRPPEAKREGPVPVALPPQGRTTVPATDSDRVSPVPSIPVVQEWRVAVLGSLESGIGRGVAPGAEAALATRWLLGGERDPSWFSPKLSLGARVAFPHATEDAVSVDAEEAVSFDGVLAAGSLRACPVWIPILARLRLGVCVGWELGATAVEASGLKIHPPASDLWSAGGAGLAADLRLGALELSVEGEGRFNATRPRYRFLADPTDRAGTLVHEVPQFSAIVKISGSLRFHKSSW